MNDASDMMTSSQARQEVLHTATTRAREVKETVSQEAGRAVENIKAAAKDQLERQRMELADSLSSVKKALRNTSTRMGDSNITSGVERVADAVESAQRFLDSHQIDDVGVALRRLSMQSPLVFYSGLFALGFAAGRFLTSTEHYSLDEPELEIDLLNAPPRLEQQTPLAKAVPYNGSY